ncbi:unnamed protein product [Ectocarpus sp. CCAP 1310/34]|nr:unnamed protein product [Ectocarpus sp. CCAP 1310/34]
MMTRWVGSSVSTPKNHRAPASPTGRQRHYGALELAGTGEQVNVNDVVEISRSAVKSEAKQPGVFPKRLRLAQVLSMWEDTFTGLFKFRARYLVYASDLPEDAIARLGKARLAFEGKGTTGSNSGVKVASASNSSTPLSKRDQKADDDEVFLTNTMEDLDAVLIDKPITLCVGIRDDSPAEWKNNLGPRLTHSFDASSGDFTPVERTDAIAKRARIRLVEAVARASRRAEEVAAADSGQPAMQSSGWLLPKRRTKGPAAAKSSAGKRGSIAVAASVGDTMSDRESSDGEPSQGEAPKSDDQEWENDDQDSDYASDISNSTDRGNHSAHDLPVGKSSRRNRSLGHEYDQDIDPSSDDKIQTSPSSPPLGLSAVTPPMRETPLVPQRDVGHQRPLPKRPRRLAMPPVEGMPALSARRSAEPLASSSTATSPKTGGPVHNGAGSTGATPSSQTPSVSRCSAETTWDTGRALGSKYRLSIAGTRTKRRSTKAAVDGADKSDCDPRQILVGDDYQADIPALLSAQERKKEAGHPAAGTGAKMVWRSIRNWDPQSRQMLSTYLHAATDVLQKKQGFPGVAVHVRLGDRGSAAKGDKGVTTSVANSYAVWAIMAGRHSAGAVRVACSEMAQTTVPISAVQRVQSEEEALAALVKARCTLDDFRPALKVLDQASLDSVAPWALSQVRTLEQVLEKEFKWDRRLHGWAREGMDLEQEDFIDLANVCKQVRGKTPAQVLSFYYRYLAHAKPLTDVVYGKEAAEARKLEAILPPGATKSPKEASTAQLQPATCHTTADPPTNGPAMHQRSIATQDTRRKPKLIIQAAPGPPLSTTERITAENRGVMPDDHKRPLATVATAGLGVRMFDSAPHYAPANGHVSREYQRQAARRDSGTASGNSSADVEVLEVKIPHNTARGVCLTPGSQYTSVSGLEAGRERQVGTKAQSRQSRALTSVGTTGSAPYGYRNVMAVARQGERLPHSHVAVHVDAKVMRECAGGSGRGHIASNGGSSSSGSGGYPLYRKPKEAAVNEDGEFGYMYPCWSLLERANAYMDQDQLVYMRGLLITNIHKPMTRDQLLERAESCLQEQPEIFMAFVKVFDRINHPYTDPPPVPLYSGTKRPTPDTPAEPRSVLRTSFTGRVLPTAGHIESRARASYSSYTQQHAVVPTYAAPPGAAVGGGGDRHGNGQGRGGGGGGVHSETAYDPYPRVAADGASYARRRWAVPATPGSGIAGWRHGASERPSTYVSGDAGPPPPSYSAGPTGRPVMMYDGRDVGFDVGGELMRAWPQNNQQHPPNRWPTGGGASSFAIPARITEARKSRSRVPGWVENGR